jgi:hypothetical protein
LNLPTKERPMESKILTCIQCDSEFEFSVANQLEYEAKG